MSKKRKARSALKTVLGGVAAPADGAKKPTVKELTKGFAKPLTPANEKLAKDALKDVHEMSSHRIKTVLPENSEPSFTFHVRMGATTKW